MSEELEQAMRRVRKVADGDTINGAYGKMPIASLVAFRDDLQSVLAALAHLQAIQEK